MSARKLLINKDITGNPFNFKDLAEFSPKSLIPKDRSQGGLRSTRAPERIATLVKYSSFDHLQQPRDACAKVCGLRDQAQHEMAFAGKIVEVSRMHDDSHLAQEINR